MATFGSLFAGIGGIDLGLERAGWNGRWQVEWDDFCCHVLEHHWPDVPRYRDIRDVDWSTVDRVDLVAGGFPCQPVSLAGKQLAQADERWLWPEFFRCVRELRPSLVLVENVPGLLGAHGGLGDVLGDLAAIGYDAEWDCIPASAVGAPHHRDRVWIVAHADDGRRLGWSGRPSGGGSQPSDCRGRRQPHGTGTPRPRFAAGGEPREGSGTSAPAGARGDGARDVPDPEGARLERTEPARHPRAGGRSAEHGSRGRSADWWATEPDVGRVAHGVPARVDRLRALGNAVVPQVVEMIGRQLLELFEEDAA